MSDDDDLAFALFLQEQFNNENNEIVDQKPSNMPKSLVDPAWEMIDPSPDIRQLFLQFNQEYFDGLLGGVEVRWSPRMTLCAGLCCYEGRGGLCSIRLSEPLLKLRPRKDLVETLLHEMIHALLFVTQNNKDHDGHGPEFHKHMYRINNKTGTNISVYHNFHDEVNSYRQHWWKCNGPCQKWPPFYGVVKRAMNRAPAPRDTWWDDHKRKCGGEFTKVKEPENYGKRKAKKKDPSAQKGPGKTNNSNSKPNLPSFFDKMKKNKAEKSNSDRKDIIQEGSDLNSESSDENVELSPKKPKIDNSLPIGFQAFSGKGHILGGSKSNSVEQNRIKHPLGSKFNTNIDKINIPSTSRQTEPIYNSKDSKTVKVEQDSTRIKHTEGSVTANGKHSMLKSRNTNSNLSIVSTKGVHNNSNNSSKKTDIPCLTIMDAFTRRKDNGESSMANGSSDKPIDLCDDDDNDDSSASSNVTCPACQSSVPLQLINHHLDNCLASL